MNIKIYFVNFITMWLISLVILFGLLSLGVCKDHPFMLSYGISFLLGILSPLKLAEVIKEEKKP